MSLGSPKYSAMTVNERLFVAGLLDSWDSAINAGDSQKAIDILCQVEFDTEQAAWTVDTTLANPSRYGFPRPSSPR